MTEPVKVTKLLVMRVSHLRIDPPALRARLRDAREKSGLSQRGLSLLVGAAPGTVGNIEDGRVESPSADMLAALAGALGTTVDFLALGDGEAPAYEAVRAAVKAKQAAKVEPDAPELAHGDLPARGA